MKKTLRERIAALAAMNVPALREEHRKVFGKEPVSSHRQFLFRKIAWRWQAEVEGRQPDQLRELARAIARDTPLRQRVVTNASKRHAGLPPEQTAVATIEPDHDPRLPMPGGWIMKHHKGKTHVVKVLGDGRFEYEDRRYKSLSAIAQEIGNQTADLVTAVTDTPVIQQQIAGLTDGGTYTFYIWARVPSGTRKVSLAIVDNAYAAYLAGPTQITLTTSWQRFKITGTLASGQSGLWIVVRQYATNGDDWTTGDIHLWGACLQQGNDPQKTYARTWASQTPHIAAGVAAGPTVIAAPDTTTSPLKIHGPGSNLADSTLLELTANGELILAGGSGNGYRFADLGAASNPSGWAGVIKVKTPAGTILGYILLYSNP